MTNFDLVAIGFVVNDGMLNAPTGSAVTVAPAGDFFTVEIALLSGAAATCTIHMSALKVSSASPASR
jgi:hypothetical protein